MPNLNSSSSGQILDTDGARYTEVLIPNMFKSFLKKEPRINKHYSLVKERSEKWLGEFCSLSLGDMEKVRQCDFTYFCAIVYPDASLERFQTVCDWGNWVFPFDDMFDDGVMRDKPKQARQILASLMSRMQGGSYDDQKHILVQAHDAIYDKLCEASSPETMIRFAASMEDYCDSVLSQVNNATAHTQLSLLEMLEMRSRSIAGSAMYVMVEYAHDLILPSVVFEHPSIKALERIGFKIIALVNDIVSYKKEEKDGVPHNMVAVCRMRGQSAQQAFDTLGSLLDAQLASWDNRVDEIPKWGDGVDDCVGKYIEGVRNMAIANLQCSFRCKRYFGNSGSIIKETRKILVLKDTPWYS